LLRANGVRSVFFRKTRADGRFFPYKYGKNVAGSFSTDDRLNISLGRATSLETRREPETEVINERSTAF
jgi:hypothetical protein